MNLEYFSSEGPGFMQISIHTVPYHSLHFVGAS